VTGSVIESGRPHVHLFLAGDERTLWLARDDGYLRKKRFRTTSTNNLAALLVEAYNASLKVGRH
jgi:hypothetical protein